MLESLAAVGVSPGQITDVLLTHAHDDHMGGLVHHGQLTFSNATIHMGQADLYFFLNRSNSALAHYDMSYFDQAFTALKPYFDAGKIKAFRGSTEVLPGVTATVHPGHTPGSAFYLLSSKGQNIVFTGDIIHVAAVQAPAPEVTITYDVAPAMAAAVRERAFSEFARDRTLLAVPHFAFSGHRSRKASWGRIRVDSGVIWQSHAYRQGHFCRSSQEWGQALKSVAPRMLYGLELARPSHVALSNLSEEV